MVLHCTTEYPTPMSEVNLHAMQSIQAAFGVAVGYSDHKQGLLLTARQRPSVGMFIAWLASLLPYLIQSRYFISVF